MAKDDDKTSQTLNYSYDLLSLVITMISMHHNDVTRKYQTKHIPISGCEFKFQIKIKSRNRLASHAGADNSLLFSLNGTIVFRA